MAKKVLGWGFKLSSETFEKAISVYYPSGGYSKSRAEVQKDIESGKKSGDIPKTAKPKIFKVVIETQE